MPSNVLLIGGGGHCHSCIEVLLSVPSLSIYGIIDTPEKRGQLIMGFPVIGSDSDLSSLFGECDKALITIGFVTTPEVREQLFSLLSSIGYQMPPIVASTAHTAQSSIISEGTIIMHFAMVNAMARIGTNCIINNRALIEHDVIIGNNCHVSTGAIVNGNCIIGDECLIGSGAVIKHGVTIVRGCIIGAGSIVPHDIDTSGVYVGNPARKIR